MRFHGRAAVAAAMAAALVMALCSCGVGADSATGKASEGEYAPSSYTPGNAERRASNMADYIGQFLNGSSDVSSWQRTVLERAQRRGKVSRSDYESAWSNYKQCMVDKGYAGITILTLGSGLHLEAGYEQGNDSAREQKYLDDRKQCENEYLNVIDEIYRAQIGNPNLYSSQADGAVDCLHRKGLVPRGYTVDQFNKEHSEVTGVFESRKPAVRSCLAANHYFVGFTDDPSEKLW